MENCKNVLQDDKENLVPLVHDKSVQLDNINTTYKYENIIHMIIGCLIWILLKIFCKITTRTESYMRDFF